MIFGKLICKWRGHVWRRPSRVAQDVTVKTCARCGEAREVKRRTRGRPTETEEAK